MMRAPVSARLLGRSALMMPTGSPTSHEMTTDSTPISALSGPRRMMRSATLSSRKNDLPSSPLTTSPIHFRYCTGSGSLRPSSAM